LAEEREDVEEYYRMNPESHDPIQLTRNLLETFDPFLQPNMKLSVEFLEGEPANVHSPEWVELQVLSPPSLSSLEDEVYKPATLSSGMQVQVSQFIRTGDLVKVNLASKKYIEKMRGREAQKPALTNFFALLKFDTFFLALK
jgi:elongation factor P